MNFQVFLRQLQVNVNTKCIEIEINSGMPEASKFRIQQCVAQEPTASVHKWVTHNFVDRIKLISFQATALLVWITQENVNCLTSFFIIITVHLSNVGFQK